METDFDRHYYCLNPLIVCVSELNVASKRPLKHTQLRKVQIPAVSFPPRRTAP